MNAIRCLVIFFNFIFVILGLILIGIGVWGEVTLEDYFKLDVLEGYYIDSAPRILIAAGVIIAIVALFGFLGAWRENKVLLIIFFVLLLILLALEIAAAVLAFEKRDKLKKQLEEEFKNKMKTYSNSNKIKGIDDVQKKIKCCGFDGYMDWSINDELSKTKSVPSSCCKVEQKDCGTRIIGSKSVENNIYTKGCFKQASEDIKKAMIPIGVVAIILIVAQVLGMIFALVLIRQVGKNA